LFTSNNFKGLEPWQGFEQSLNQNQAVVQDNTDIPSGGGGPGPYGEGFLRLYGRRDQRCHRQGPGQTGFTSDCLRGLTDMINQVILVTHKEIEVENLVRIGKARYLMDKPPMRPIIKKSKIRGAWL